jgi:hypothetical protein
MLRRKRKRKKRCLFHLDITTQLSTVTAVYAVPLLNQRTRKKPGSFDGPLLEDAS